MKKKNLNAKKKIHNFYLSKLKNPKIKKLYLEFEKNLREEDSKKLCIAVSGGSDSMALTFLAKCLSIKKNLNFHYFTVDHRLRSSSTKEALLLKQKLKKFGIFCDILTWRKHKNFSNLQSESREKRYELIFKKCEKKQTSFVLTAHQKNDVIENFFIRLLRGSGLKGLSTFKNKKTKIKKNFNVYVVRPLLNFSKEDLSFITRNTFDFNIEDPSNQNEDFLRIKIRNLISLLKKNGLTFEKFNLTLENLHESNKAIDYYVKRNIDKNTNILKLNKSIIINEIFFNQPREVIFRSLSELILHIGNKQSFTRGKKILNLLNDIIYDKNFKKKTLSGCIFKKINKSVIISREI